MSSSDQYEIEFIWPSAEPKTVIVTGTFDQWSSTLRLNKTSTGFEVKTRVPWGEKVKYKFIVDGQWLVRDDRPTEVDFGGYVNNVVVTPSKPPTIETPATEETLNGNANGHAPVKGTANGVINGGASNGTGFLSNLASTIVARDGTSSTLGYVASGLGAAMHSVVGVDPINTQQIAIPTPIADQMFNVPDSQESASNRVFPPESPAYLESPGSPASPIAPIVPLMIVPVNAPENSTIPRETFSPDIDPSVQIPVMSAKVPAPPSSAAVDTAIIVTTSEVQPTPAVIDTVVVAETTSTDQPTSVAAVVLNEPSQSESVSTAIVEEVPETTPAAEVALPVAVPEEVVVDVTSTAEAPAPEKAPGEVIPAAAVIVEETTVSKEEPAVEVGKASDVPAPVVPVPVVVAVEEPVVAKETPAETTAVSAAEPVKAEPTVMAAPPKTPPPVPVPTTAQQPSTPEPTTPTKNKFPSVSQKSSPSGSPASSKYGSTKRQKRSSMLGKLKHIFHLDKEKSPEKEEKEKVGK